MDLSNIEKNMRIKNYKELCRLLNEQVKGGDSKKAHISEIERFLELEKDGHALIIKKIYKKPLEKSDGRMIYNEYVQKLILDMLAQRMIQENKGGVTILSTGEFLRKLKIVNDNYSFCRGYKNELSELLNVEKENIQEFFLITYASLQKILEGGFNALKNKSLIMWNKTVQIDVRTKSGESMHREATDEEKEIILDYERDILDKMGYKNKSKVMAADRWEEFNMKVHELLNQYTNINYYYKAYKVIFTQRIIRERNTLAFHLNEKERTKEQNQLNKNTVSQLHNSAVDRAYKETGGKKSFGGKPKNIRADRKYVEKTDKLIHTLIKKNTKSVEHKIKEIKREGQKNVE